MEENSESTQGSESMQESPGKENITLSDAMTGIITSFVSMLLKFFANYTYASA